MIVLVSTSENDVPLSNKALILESKFKFINFCISVFKRALFKIKLKGL